MRQSGGFCSHNALCCFSASVCCCLFRYDLVRKLLDTPSCNGAGITHVSFLDYGQVIRATHFLVLNCTKQLKRVVIILLTSLEVCVIIASGQRFTYDFHSVSAGNIWISEMFIVCIV